MVSNILKRSTVLVMPRNAHVWRPELVYLPGDIDKLITKTLLESFDNDLCIQNYVSSHDVQVPSTAGGNKIISSTNGANTETTYPVADGLKTFTPKSTEVVWNESKKGDSLTDTSCVKSHNNTLQTSDITIENTTRYNNGVSVETTARNTKQIQKNNGNAYGETPAETKAPYQIQIPLQTMTAYGAGTPVGSTLIYTSELHKKTNATAYQKETVTKITTTYHNIPEDVKKKEFDGSTEPDITSNGSKHLKVNEDTATSNWTTKDLNISEEEKQTQDNIPPELRRVHSFDDFRQALHVSEAVDRGQPRNPEAKHSEAPNSAQPIASFQNYSDFLDSAIARAVYVNETNTHSDSSEIIASNIARNDSIHHTFHLKEHTAGTPPKETAHGLGDSTIRAEIKPTHLQNVVDTTTDRLGDRANYTELVTSRNVLATTADGLEKRTTNMESLTVRELPQTPPSDMKDRRTHMEVVTARNPLTTTNGLDDKKHKKFVTASHTIETNDRKTNIESVSSRSSFYTNNDELDDGKNTESVTAKDLFQVTTLGWEERTTNMEAAAVRNILQTASDELSDRTTGTEFVTSKDLFYTNTEELDDGATSTEFVTARNLLKTTNDEMDETTTSTEFVTSRNLLKTTNDEMDGRTTSTEFVTSRNLLKTTNDEMDETTTSTEFVTSRNLLKTTNHELDERKTNTEFVTSRNLLQTVIYGMQTTSTEYVTPRTTFERNTESLKDSATKTELATASDVLRTVTANLTDNTGDILFDVLVTPLEILNGGLSVCEKLAACKGTNIQLAVTTDRPRDSNSTATTDSLETVDTTGVQSESNNYLLHSATQSMSDLTQDSSPVFHNTIATSPASLPNQPLQVTTAPSTEPPGNTDYDKINQGNTDEKGATHLKASNQTVPGKEESISSANSTSHVNIDNDSDIFEQTTEHAQSLHNSTSVDIFEIMAQMVNSTISPAELLTLQILYELLLSKYDVAYVSEDMKTPGGANSTHRVPPNGVWSEIRNTIKVLEHIPGIMDDHTLDNVTDEEINSLREAVEYVWSIVENETEVDINSSLMKTHHEADRSLNSGTFSQMPETKRDKSKRQVTERLLGKHGAVPKSLGNPLGFVIRNVIYNAKNGLASLVTGNATVISDSPPEDTRNSQKKGRLL
jgi:hypothetical protein